MTYDLRDFKAGGYEQDVLVKAFPEMGIEVEDIKETDIILSVTPNRPDFLDFTGLIRGLDNYTGKKTPREGYYKVEGDPAIKIKVEKAVKKVRPFIAGLVVKNLDLSGNKLKYLINFTEKFADTFGRRRKKIAIGIHSLSVIKGNVTYTASKSDSFVPLGHQKKMGFEEIMKEHDKGVTYQDTVPLYGTGKAMFPHIRDDEKILALIPITNSEATKTTEKTKEVFVDITGTSKKAVAETAALLACSFQYSGAEVHSVAVDYGGKIQQTPHMEYREIKLNLRKAAKSLGVDVARHDVVKLANKMGYVAAKYGNKILFYVPPYRVDVLNDQDVTEDVAIAFGYDNITPLPIMGFSTGLADDANEMENRLAIDMVGLGYLEAVNSVLTNEKTNFENLLIKYREGDYIKVADSKSAEATMVRSSILPGLLKNLSESKNDRLPQRMFEIGKVFSLEEGFVKESLRMGIVCEHSKANFAEIKAVVENVMKFLEIDYRFEPHKGAAFIEGRCASILVNGESIGTFGELHPMVLEKFGLEEPTVGGFITLIKEIKY